MMIKRKWAIVMSAAVIMTGCSRERVETTRTEPAGINFATPSLTTRGTAVTTPALLAAAGGFDVWAYSHTGDWSSATTKNGVLEEVTVISDDNGATWTYTSPAEWPANNDNVSFFAYAPAGAATVTNDTDGTPLITFTVASTAAQQKDLLIANQLYDQQGIDYFPAMRKVNLYFNHALSQIVFSASYTGTAYDVVKLTGIVLKNVYNSGTATMTTPVTWTIDDTHTADYSLIVGDDGLNDISLSDTPQNVTAAGGMLYLMPQSVDRATDAIEMEVTFDIDGGNLSYNSPVVLPTDWVAGKSYRYQITLDDEAIRVIVIDSDISLSGWLDSIVLQTVILTSDQSRDLSSITFALSVLNYVNTGSWINYLTYGIYGVNDVNHDLTIDIGAMGLDNFTRSGQYLLFDFKKTIRTWGVDSANNNQPWTISVTNYSSGWSLAPSQQNLPPDATSGPTLPAGQVSDAITARGTILLQKQ